MQGMATQISSSMTKICVISYRPSLVQRLFEIMRTEPSLDLCEIHQLGSVSKETCIFLVDEGSLTDSLESVVKSLTRRHGGARAVVIGEREIQSVSHAIGLLRLGIHGWLLAKQITGGLIPVIQLVAGGMWCLHPFSVTVELKPAVPLTQREKEIVELLYLHYSDRELAQRLSISPNTAKSYVASVLRKYGVTSRRALTLGQNKKDDVVRKVLAQP
jgi:DNA-binding CsgD family transcriptional regulator